MIKVRAVKLGNAVKCGNEENTWIPEDKYDVWLLRNDWVKIKSKTKKDSIYTSRDNVIAVLPYEEEGFENHVESLMVSKQSVEEFKNQKEPVVKAK